MNPYPLMTGGPAKIEIKPGAPCNRGAFAEGRTDRGFAQHRYRTFQGAVKTHS